MVRQGGPARSGSQDGKAADKRLLGPGRGALDALGHFLGVGIAPVPGIGNEAKPRQRLAQTVEVQFAPADMIGHLLPVRHPVGGKGGIINEQRLERLLEAEGYTAVHPERLSLREQFSIFKGARNILGLDGSAFHVLGYVANPDQRAGIIIRRSSPAYHHIAEHLRGFTGRPPEIINHLAADWMPDRQKLANHVSWGELDFDGLGQTLAGLGFIADARNWCNPDPEEMAQSVERAATRTQEPLVRRLAVL